MQQDTVGHSRMQWDAAGHALPSHPLELAERCLHSAQVAAPNTGSKQRWKKVLGTRAWWGPSPAARRRPLPPLPTPVCR